MYMLGVRVRTWYQLFCALIKKTFSVKIEVIKLTPGGHVGEAACTMCLLHCTGQPTVAKTILWLSQL